jgi:acyl dehydratase
MAIVYQQLKSRPFPVIEHTYKPKDTMLYALGLGLGLDPMDQDQLRFTYEEGLRALPTMSVVLAYPGFWAKEPDAGLDWQKILHGEQWIRLHKPLPAAGTVTGQQRITEILDKGAGKGALLFSERDIRDKATGDLLATVGGVTFARGDGGFGGPTGPQPEPHRLPDRAPDKVYDFKTSPQAALVYRLSGDMNPLHADPKVAAAAGFKQPILHGLCSFGVAGFGLLKLACDGDPARLKSMQLRFSAPVSPGETVRTEAWLDGKSVSFRARVVERDVVVLNNGRAEIS